MTHIQNRLLGIDYGSKRIGVAMTDEAGDLAMPHSVVKNSRLVVNDVLRLIAKNDVKKVVIGESKDFAGNNNPIMNDIKRFVDNLRRETSVEVVFHPEFMTSAQAEHIQGKVPKLDSSAAAIILQSYIDTTNYPNRTE